MVVDTSALLAVILKEPSRQSILNRLESSAPRVLSAVSLLEAGMVVRSRLGPSAMPLLQELVDDLGCEVIPFDQMQARLAVNAFSRFGKGLGHRAQLNFGDCAVYALAISRGEAVLALGNDFSATDLAVLPPDTNL